MSLSLRDVTGVQVDALIPDLARLRIAVFRDWPYLYDGDFDYEARYLSSYAQPGAIVVAAEHDGQLVGAATGMPLAAHKDDFAVAFAGSGIDLDSVFYCAESVLLPDWRGQGTGHGFFDHREAFARAGGFTHSAFCAVLRPDDHPMRPVQDRPLGAFWSARGYAPCPGIVAQFKWRDLGQSAETAKPLQFWMKDLE